MGEVRAMIVSENANFRRPDSSLACFVLVPSFAPTGSIRCYLRGDLYLVVFKVQRLIFTETSGENYALLVDEPSTLLTTEVHAPIPELPVITCITGVGLTAADTDGGVHIIQIRVEEPADIFAHHECPKSEPCLEEGVLTVLLDGKPMSGPGVASLGPAVSVGAISIPGECRPLGFDN